MYRPAACVIILVTFQNVLCQTDGQKWIWSKNNSRSISENNDDKIYTGLSSTNNQRRYNGELGSSGTPGKNLFEPSQGFSTLTISRPSNSHERYEIEEHVEDVPRPGVHDFRPTVTTNNNSYRPINNGNNPINGGLRPPINNYRPQTFNRPTNDFNRPLPPNNGPYRPVRPLDGNGGYRPNISPHGQPTLTGPVPSWHQPHDPNRYKDYDKCKCVHSFNCNTPGITFGNCDVDKQYCCYTSRPNVGPPNIRDPHFQTGPRPILVGPSSPVGPGGSAYDRPPVKKRPTSIGGKPFGPFSDLDRYLDNEEDRELEELYKKGLETAVHEQYRPIGDKSFDYQSYKPNSYRDYYTDDRDYNERDRYTNNRDKNKSNFNRFDGKYGLHVETYSSGYGGRSSGATIVAQNTTSS